MENELLTTRQLAKRLRVTIHTIRRWAREGKLPHLRIGPKVIRFSWLEIQNAVKKLRKSK